MEILPGIQTAILLHQNRPQGMQTGRHKSRSFDQTQVQAIFFLVSASSHCDSVIWYFKIYILNALECLSFLRGILLLELNQKGKRKTLEKNLTALYLPC